MQRIGLTGGIGTGKSTVSEFLRELGAWIIDADLGAREVVKAPSPGLRRIRQVFGDAVLTDRGELNRGALAAVVFADPQRLRQLNAIVHPLVHMWMARQERAASKAGQDLVIFDVPLLIEGGLHRTMDVVILVYAPQQVQVERLLLKGYERPHAMARIEAQMPIDSKRQYADYIIDNSGDVESTRQQVSAVWQALSQWPASSQP